METMNETTNKNGMNERKNAGCRRLGGQGMGLGRGRGLGNGTGRGRNNGASGRGQGLGLGPCGGRNR